MNAAESEKVMFGLATSRCSLGRMAVQPVKPKTVSTPKPASVSRRSKGVILLRDPGSILIIGIGK